MDDFDHDRVKRDTVDMEFISDISDRLSAFTSSVKWDQGQAAFPPIPRAKDHVFEIDNGSNASATLRSSNSSQNNRGKLLAPGNFAFSFALPPPNSSVVGSTFADGSAVPMDVCLPDSDTKTGEDNVPTFFSSVTEQHNSRISGPIADKGLFHVPAPEQEQSSITAKSIPDQSTPVNYANLFQIPPASAPHVASAATVGQSTDTPASIEYDTSSQQVVTRPLFQLPLPSGPKDQGIVLPSADSPAAIKHVETQQVVASSLFQLPPPSAPDPPVILPCNVENPEIQKYDESKSARPLFHVPLPSAPRNPLITQPDTNSPATTYAKSQQDSVQHVFDGPACFAPSNAIAAEPNADTIATVQDTNVLPSRSSLTPSPILRGAAQPKPTHPPGRNLSGPEFIDLLTELSSNFSTPAGILRGHANSLRRSHDETTKRLVENLKNRDILTHLVTHLEGVITVRRSKIFQENFTRK
jgi:hypothetical protein